MKAEWLHLSAYIGCNGLGFFSLPSAFHYELKLNPCYHYHRVPDSLKRNINQRLPALYKLALSLQKLFTKVNVCLSFIRQRFSRGRIAMHMLSILTLMWKQLGGVRLPCCVPHSHGSSMIKPRDGSTGSSTARWKSHNDIFWPIVCCFFFLLCAKKAFYLKQKFSARMYFCFITKPFFPCKVKWLYLTFFFSSRYIPIPDNRHFCLQSTFHLLYIMCLK